MLDDSALLQRYTTERSEAAFAELVRRHIDLVYGVALRRCGGDAQLAEDATQIVFTTLARKAGQLLDRPVLGGWLYRNAQYTATDLVRTESRRRRREQEAHLMNEMTGSEACDDEWTRLRPVLDGAMSELKDDDRDALVLRFFEGRSFADVGSRLRLTENAARMRVERALEKLHRLLVRRGVTSTSAALGTALTSHAAVTAPAGLAASVTGLALTGAAAGGAAVGLASLFGFMSTSKISGATVVAFMGLGLSVAGNVYLVTRLDPAPPAAVVATVAATLTAIPSEATFATLARGDMRTLRAALREAGASESLQRGIVEGILRRRYRQALVARRAEASRSGWWQINFGSNPGQVPEDPALLRELVVDPLEALFGPDPVDLAERSAKYAFLPTEKREAFVALGREALAAKARASVIGRVSAESLAIEREYDEKEQRLIATLTPAERVEHALRVSPAAARLAGRMRQIDATEQEFRAITAVLMRPENEATMFSRLLAIDPAQEQRVVSEIVAALGYDRAVDYVWAGAVQYPNYARLAQEAGLPPSTPGKVLQLAAETIDRALSVRQDPTLSPEQKRAAGLALQEAVRPQLDALIPPAQRARMGEPGRGNSDASNRQALIWQWFDGLAAGKVATISTTMAGGTGSVGSVGEGMSIDGPPQPPIWINRPLLVPRPANP